MLSSKRRGPATSTGQFLMFDNVFSRERQLSSSVPDLIQAKFQQFEIFGYRAFDTHNYNTFAKLIISEGT